MKQTNHEKERKRTADDRANKSRRPAQEIADDEVEIAETGGKPGSDSQPIGTKDPGKKA